MGKLKIIKPGIMTSIQDLGRQGLAYYAISASGVMDSDSAQLANILIGNNESYPVIECTSIAPMIEFLSDGKIALTGAECKYLLNNKSIKNNTPYQIKKGDILTGGTYTNGLRGYIAVDGKIKRDSYLGSISYHSYPHNDFIKKSLLKKNNIVEWYSENNDTSDTSVHIKRSDDNIINIVEGPEYSYLTQANKDQLISQYYNITAQTNRMGIRLSGFPIIADKNNLDHSVAVFPGVMQLTSSGQLIILLQDAQTTGGYPRIAYIRNDQLSKLNQIRIGQEIRFSFC